MLDPQGGRIAVFNKRAAYFSVCSIPSQTYLRGFCITEYGFALYISRFYEGF